jgi:dTDP-4-amino-4,6-dideoxygalactose transaminase
VHDRFGTNWRLTEPQSAIGRVQLGKLEGWVLKRGELAAVYAQRLGQLQAVRIPAVPAGMRHAYYRFYAYLNAAALKPGWNRERILAALVEAGIRAFSGSCSEIYRERAFEGTGWAPEGGLPVARELGETSLAFLVHPTLTVDHVHADCDLIESTLRAASR